MTGVRTISFPRGAWTSGILLIAAAVWLSRADLVLPAPDPPVASPASPEIVRPLGMRLREAAGGPGVVVLEVVSGSPAARAGVQPGDTVTFVNDQFAASAGQVEEMLQGDPSAGSLMLEVVREGSTLVLSVDREPSAPAPQASPAGC